CTNELVKIVPKEQYYTFGIKNVANYLDFIYQRETTFPTFLELLMATYHLIQDAKRNGFEDLVQSLIDEEQLLSTIHRRADYQRTGYFYPEIAMYFKNPKRILGSFFIKHHGFRVRIDDIEHYLSGYIQYQKVFK
ncbi:poly(glycerol-phosphate) alpha-glucosyltransferase, partial [Staphylococcus felis]